MCLFNRNLRETSLTLGCEKNNNERNVELLINLGRNKVDRLQERSVNFLVILLENRSTFATSTVRSQMVRDHWNFPNERE